MYYFNIYNNKNIFFSSLEKQKTFETKEKTEEEAKKFIKNFNLIYDVKFSYKIMEA